MGRGRQLGSAVACTSPPPLPTLCKLYASSRPGCNAGRRPIVIEPTCDRDVPVHTSSRAAGGVEMRCCNSARVNPSAHNLPPPARTGVRAGAPRARLTNVRTRPLCRGGAGPRKREAHEGAQAAPRRDAAATRAPQPSAGARAPHCLARGGRGGRSQHREARRLNRAGGRARGGAWQRQRQWQRQRRRR